MKLRTSIWAALGALLTLCGCSGTDILNFIIPHAGYTVHQDIAYGEHPRQRLDIYVPDKQDPSRAVIVFFYGGSWQFGGKNQYRFVGQAFASKGYITVIADYRLYPEVYFPAFMEDSAQAFAWAHNHIGEYGGDPASLFAAGHSAGAYNAVMLTLDERFIRGAGGRPSWIKGTAGIAGPYDFLPMTDPKIVALFSKAEARATQPITYARSHTPPMLLLTGDADTEVLPRNTLNLAARLRALGDPVTQITYPGVAHIGIVLALAQGFRGKAPVLEDIAAFIRAHTHPEAHAY